MGKHIRPESWQVWSNKENFTTTFYAEYENRGPGAKKDNRVGWSQQLSKNDSKQYTIKNILGEWAITK